MPRRLRLGPLCLLAALPFLLAACGSTARRDARFLEGRWAGALHQAGLAPFEVRAHIRTVDNADDNTVAYTGLNCRGHWRYLGHNGSSYDFEEVIDAGRSATCKGVGTVALAPLHGDRLAYVFQGGGVVSRGVLSRQR
jgi:hypothetical protein